jgi:head-tail adaptor
MMTGKKNKIIELSRPLDTEHNRYETRFFLWASIMPLEGKQMYKQRQVHSEMTHRFWTRWDPKMAGNFLPELDLAPSWRLTFPSTTLLPAPLEIFSGTAFGASETILIDTTKEFGALPNPVRWRKVDQDNNPQPDGDKAEDVADGTFFGINFVAGILVQTERNIQPGFQGWHLRDYRVWTYRTPDRYFDIISFRNLGDQDLEIMAKEKL